jgi:uncharacterized protein (TIGR02145 family)
MIKTTIMKHIFTISLCFLALSLSAQTPSQIEACEYDPLSGRWFVSNGNNTMLSTSNQGESWDYFGSANATHGMEAMGNVLFVLDNNVLRSYDIDSGEELGNKAIPGASFLNGMGSDGNGTLIISDFSSGRIIKADVTDPTEMNISTLVENLGTTPNGVVVDAENNRAIIVNWGGNADILSVDIDSGEVTTLVNGTGLGNCDGIDMDSWGRYYVSSWSPNRITRFSNDFSSSEAVVSSGLSSPADISYAQDINVLGVANSGSNIVSFYEFGDFGCTDQEACNFNSEATIEDGSCDYLSCAGCTTPFACNYDPQATQDDGSCEFICEGCTDEGACNYDPSANVDDSSCEYLSCTGCTDAVACNFNLESTIDDGSCLYPEQYYDCFGGCVNDSDSDGICDELEIPGCTDEGSCNFDLQATDDDGSCEYETCAGCQYEFACNYDPEATIADNESCEYGTCPGCTDSTACNYNPTVSEDDGSCSYNIDAIGICGGSCTSDSNNDGICDIQLCPEDLNGDGVIGVQDLLLVLSEFGCASSCDNDINQDGYVAVQDILLLLSGFGSTCEISGFQNCGDLVSHDGYDYSTVLIGDQCWFSENCRYLPEVSPSSASSTTDPYYYVYGYEGTDVASAMSTPNYDTYGVLYNWSAVMTEGLCPSGWHIPSDGEFTQLTDFLGGESVAGGKMKEAGLDHWSFPNTGATNSSGWTGLPGGYCAGAGVGFNFNGEYEYWWSASESGSLSWGRELGFAHDNVSRFNVARYFGWSARCVRD